MASTDAEAPHATPLNQRPPNITMGLPCFCLLSPQVWGSMASSTSCSSSNLTGTISTGMSLRTHAHIKPTTMLNLSSSTATSSSGADQAPQGTAWAMTAPRTRCCLLAVQLASCHKRQQQVDGAAPMVTTSTTSSCHSSSTTRRCCSSSTAAAATMAIMVLPGMANFQASLPPSSRVRRTRRNRRSGSSSSRIPACSRCHRSLHSSRSSGNGRTAGLLL